MERHPVAQVLDPVQPLGRGAADHAVDLVALLQQQLGEIRTVLTGDPGDQRTARRGHAAEDYIRVGGWRRAAI